MVLKFSGQEAASPPIIRGGEALRAEQTLYCMRHECRRPIAERPLLRTPTTLTLPRRSRWPSFLAGRLPLPPPSPSAGIQFNSATPSAMLPSSSA